VKGRILAPLVGVPHQKVCLLTSRTITVFLRTGRPCAPEAGSCCAPLRDIDMGDSQADALACLLGDTTQLTAWFFRRIFAISIGTKSLQILQ
jgi:hypothetical protein